MIFKIVVILKHMILLKQNRCPPEIYNNYTALLKRDYLLTVQHHYNLDISFLIIDTWLSFLNEYPTHVVSERIGFSVLATSSLVEILRIMLFLDDECHSIFPSDPFFPTVFMEDWFVHSWICVFGLMSCEGNSFHSFFL